MSGDLGQKTGRVGKPGNVTITLKHPGNEKIGEKGKADPFLWGKRRVWYHEAAIPAGHRRNQGCSSVFGSLRPHMHVPGLLVTTIFVLISKLGAM